MSDAVAVLRRKGLIERRGASRRAPLALTSRGREAAEAVSGWLDRTRALLAGLPADDKEHTLRVATDLIAHLQRTGVITVARMCATCRFFRRDAHPGTPQPHHCALLDAPMAGAELRINCDEHEPAAQALQ